MIFGRTALKLLASRLRDEHRRRLRAETERDEFKRLWVESVNGRLQNRPSVTVEQVRHREPAEPQSVHRTRAVIEREGRDKALQGYSEFLLTRQHNGQPNDVENPSKPN